jgi:hypothetical protein
MLTFRGGSEYYSGSWLSTIRPTGLSRQIAGTLCEEFLINKGAINQRFWLAPSLGYVVKRILISNGSQASSQWDVEYEKAKEIAKLWVPVSWTSSQYGSGGKLAYSLRGKVVAYSINKPIEEASFEVSFPVGSPVFDNRNMKEYVVNSGGKLELVSRPGTTSSPLDSDLVTSAWYVRHFWLTLATLLLVCAGRVYFVRKRLQL